MLAIENSSQLLGRSADVVEGGSVVLTVEGREVAVFRRDGLLFAIDDHCPHKQASMAAGSCGDMSVACPWHGWKFDLRTGESLDHPGFRVAVHDVEERDDELWIRLAEVSEVRDQGSEVSELPADDSTPGADDWANSVRCLIRYGAMNWAGYFRYQGENPITLRHGERVLVQTTRGVEVGEVRSSLSAVPPRNDEEKIIRPAGELLRPLRPMETFEHARRQRDAGLREQVESVVREASRRIAERGVAIDLVDGEMLFGNETLVLYFLGPPTADLGRLATELGQGRDYNVVFNSVIEQPAAASSGGCGSSGCGCSTK